jgi:hypothetical protein
MWDRVVAGRSGVSGFTLGSSMFTLGGYPLGDSASHWEASFAASLWISASCLSRSGVTHWEHTYRFSPKDVQLC